MPIYMKIEGVTGAVKTGKYRGWIELQSLQTVGGPAGIGTSASVVNRGATEPPFSEMVVTKYQDDRSMALANFMNEKEGKKATIDFVRTDGSPYLQYVTENTLITAYVVSVKAGMESLMLNFTKVTSSTVASTTPGKVT